MAATTQKSNFINHEKLIETQPNWQPIDQSQPQAAVLTEHTNTGICKFVGRPIFGNRVSGRSIFVTVNADAQSINSADFTFKLQSFDKISSFKLTSVILLCGSVIPETSPIAETNELIGYGISGVSTLIDPNLRNTFDFIGNNSIYVRNISTGAEHIFNFHFSSLTQPFFEDKILNLILRLKDALEVGITNLGGPVPANFDIFVDGGDAVIFFSWAGGVIDINLTEEIDDNFYTIFSNFFTLRRVVPGFIHFGNSGTAYFFRPEYGASFPTFQNGFKAVSIHSNILTRFKNKTSVSFADGDSVIGFLNLTATVLSNLHDGHFTTENGGLVSSKINFDPTFFNDEFQVSLKVITNSATDVEQSLRIDTTRKIYMQLDFEVT